MTIALIDHTIAGSTTGSNVTSAGIDTTGANLIVVGLSWNTAAGSPALTDSKSNTVTASLTERANGVSHQLRYYLNPSSVGSGHTFTATASGGRVSIAVLAFSGISAYDSQENGAAAANGTSRATGSITPSQDNCLVVSGMTAEIPSSGASIDGTGFTPYTTDAVLAQHTTAGISWKIQTTAAAENRTWSWTTSGHNAASIASFKAAPGNYFDPIAVFGIEGVQIG